MSQISPQPEPWRIDKHIPIALILAILMQTGAGFWWASSINERVFMLERARDAGKNDGERLAVLESQTADIKVILQRIESTLAERDSGRP